MESIVIGSVFHILDASIRQQDVILSLSDSIRLLVLRVPKIISRVEISHSISKCVARLLLMVILLLLLLIRVHDENEDLEKRDYKSLRSLLSFPDHRFED